MVHVASYAGQSHDLRVHHTCYYSYVYTKITSEFSFQLHIYGVVYVSIQYSYTCAAIASIRLADKIATSTYTILQPINRFYCIQYDVSMFSLSHCV